MTGEIIEAKTARNIGTNIPGLKIEILPETTHHPISLVGQRAAVCWNSDSDPTKDYTRGLRCIQSKHGRVMEYVNIEFVVYDMSARAIRELYTHIGGAPTRLQASTRYIDYSSSDFYIPRSLIGNEKYINAMKGVIKTYNELLVDGFPKEDIANMLPLGMFSKTVLKCNLRMLENLMEQRLCGRTYEEMREFAATLKKALISYGDKFRDVDGINQWEEIANNLFLPKCEKLGYCTETGSCGREPYKKVEWDHSQVVGE